MSKKKRSSTGLMLNDDPKETIKALCRISDSVFDKESYIEQYKKVIKRVKPLSRQHKDTHFYTLSIYGLIKPTPGVGKAKFSVSTIGKILCKSLVEKRDEDYKRTLAGLLLNNNKKGPLFESFVNFVKNNDIVSDKQARDFVEQEIIKKKTARTGLVTRTLIAWSKEAGLIERDTERKIIWAIKNRSDKPQLSLEEFFGKIVEKYNILKESEIFGIENLFVDILELRTLVCIELSWTNEDFNNHLIRLLDSKYGEAIRLYGAPTSVFEDRNNFSYNGRVYADIKIRC